MKKKTTDKNRVIEQFAELTRLSTKKIESTTEKENKEGRTADSEVVLKTRREQNKNL